MALSASLLHVSPVWTARTYAAEAIAGPVTATVIRIVDGDTLLVDAEPWPQQIMRVYVRLRGMDAAELHAKCASERDLALRAQDRLGQMIAASSTVRLREISGDKYFGRIVALVELQDGTDLSQDMLQAGLAKAYHGGRKERWACDS